MAESLLQLYFSTPAADETPRPAGIASRHATLLDTVRHDVHHVHDDAVDMDRIDIALVQRIHAGDAGAFDLLIRGHFTALVRFAASFVGTRDAAEDVVQDVLTRLWMRRHHMPTTGSVRAFLFTATRNHALNVLKHNRVVARSMEMLSREQSIASRGSDEATRDALARLDAVIVTLPERQRSALALRYGQGLRVAEVAAVVGISTKAAEQLLVRALRTLRAAVASEHS